MQRKVHRTTLGRRTTFSQERRRSRYPACRFAIAMMSDGHCGRRNSFHEIRVVHLIVPRENQVLARPNYEKLPYPSCTARADERTRTAYPCSLRVITQALQGFAEACKSRTSRRLSVLWVAGCCTVLRSRWYQSGISLTALSLPMRTRPSWLATGGKTRRGVRTIRP